VAEDRRFKPKPEDVKLIDADAFEREVGILFQVPPSEVAAIETARPKRPYRGKRKGEKGAT
jgi:hypothetical protein